MIGMSRQSWKVVTICDGNRPKLQALMTAFTSTNKYSRDRPSRAWPFIFQIFMPDPLAQRWGSTSGQCCQHAVLIKHTICINFAQCSYLPVRNSSKLKVIYPSLSSSYRLNTSVILFSMIQLCTNKSKLIRSLPLLS